MKRLIFFAAMALLFCPGCNTEQRAANQSDAKATDTARQQRQMYQDKIQAKLRELDREIENLKNDVGRRSKANRKQLDQQTADLERKRDAAHQQLKELEKSSQSAWGDMKVGIEAALRDLEVACKQAASHFK